MTKALPSQNEQVEIQIEADQGSIWTGFNSVSETRDLIWIMAIGGLLLFVLSVGLGYLVKGGKDLAAPFSSAGALFQGSFGVAASIGGATVAIWLASLANRTLNRQNHRESFGFVMEIGSSAIAPLLRVSSRMHSVYDEIAFFSFAFRGYLDTLATALSNPQKLQGDAWKREWMRIMSVANGVPDESSGTLDLNQLVSEVENVKVGLGRTASLLEELCRAVSMIDDDLYSRHIWLDSQQQLRNRQGTGTTAYRRLSVSDPQRLALYLRSAVDLLQSMNRGLKLPAFMAKTHASSVDFEDCLAPVIMLGRLITTSSTDPHEGERALCELIMCIPSTQRVQQVICQLVGKAMTPEVQKLSPLIDAPDAKATIVFDWPDEKLRARASEHWLELASQKVPVNDADDSGVSTS